MKSSRQVAAATDNNTHARGKKRRRRRSVTEDTPKVERLLEVYLAKARQQVEAQQHLEWELTEARGREAGQSIYEELRRELDVGADLSCRFRQHSTGREFEVKYSEIDQPLLDKGYKRNVSEDGYPLLGGRPLHQLIMPPPPPGWVIDHRNRDRLDNTRGNLHTLPLPENTRRGGYKESEYSVRGVRNLGKRFEVQKSIHGLCYAKSFATADQAINKAHYLDWLRRRLDWELYGWFPNENDRVFLDSFSKRDWAATFGVRLEQDGADGNSDAGTFSAAVTSGSTLSDSATENDDDCRSDAASPKNGGGNEG